MAAGTVANDLADEQPIVNITPNNDHDDNTTTTHLTTEVVEDESSLAKDLNVNLKPVETEIVNVGNADQRFAALNIERVMAVILPPMMYTL